MDPDKLFENIIIEMINSEDKFCNHRFLDKINLSHKIITLKLYHHNSFNDLWHCHLKNLELKK
jgi:hypothetical protein